MSYLHRRDGGTCYFRRAVPDELREVLGKREIYRSLGTKDRREADRLVIQEAVKVDAEFERAKQFRSLSMNDALALAHKHWTRVLQEDAEERASSPEHKHPQDADDLVPQADEFQHMLNEYRAALSSDDARCPDYSLAYFEVRRIIESEQLPITDVSRMLALSLDCSSPGIARH